MIASHLVNAFHFFRVVCMVKLDNDVCYSRYITAAVYKVLEECSLYIARLGY
jgi:hypothetical protein